eukprot:4465438-Pleurochrysis_carterae.AAC.2
MVHAGLSRMTARRCSLTLLCITLSEARCARAFRQPSGTNALVQPRFGTRVALSLGPMSISRSWGHCCLVLPPSLPNLVPRALPARLSGTGRT